MFFSFEISELPSKFSILNVLRVLIQYVGGARLNSFSVRVVNYTPYAKSALYMSFRVRAVIHTPYAKSDLSAAVVMLSDFDGVR